jgi:hypothetical protein
MAGGGKGSGGIGHREKGGNVLGDVVEAGKSTGGEEK